MYRKLKRTWTHNDLNYIPQLKKVFPELSSINSEEMANRFQELRLDFYTERKKPVNFLTRLTLPFALVVALFMLLFLPMNFFITGRWGYAIGKKNIVLNWFRALKIQ